MTGDFQIPYAWKIIIENDTSCSRLCVLTALPEHPRSDGFDAAAKLELLDAAASAAAAHDLSAFHVIWEITPALCAECVEHPSVGRIDCLTTPRFEAATCIPALTASAPPAEKPFRD